MSTTQYRPEYRFNKERTVNFFQNITLFVSIVLTVFIIGGNDLAYAITNSYNSGQEVILRRREFILNPDVRGFMDREQGSFLLFPGSKAHLVVDGLYLAFWIACTVVIVFAWLCAIFQDPKTDDFGRYWRFLSLLVPFCSMICHIFGNFHYQFYCAVGAIPQENCFWMFDYRSFLTGPAAIMAISIAGLILSIIFWYTYQIISCRMFFDEVIIAPELPSKNSVTPPPTTEVDTSTPPV